MSISKKASAIGSAFLLIFGSYLMVGSPASATATPAVTFNQENHLDDGQNILATWSNFPANSQVTIRECARGATVARDCSSPLAFGDTNSNGEGNEVFQVTRTNGIDIRVPGAPFLKCDIENLCEIRVADSSDPSSYVVSKNITFMKGAGGCPKDLANPISGKGTSSIERAFVAWGPSICSAPSSLAVDYVSQNDVFGINDFQCGLVDFAIVDLGNPDTTCPTSGEKRKIAGMAPVAVSGVTFAFNARDARTGARLDHLKLSPNTLAKIFTGQLVSLDVPEVRTLNPGVNLPDKLNVAVRADQSAATLAVTTYLNDLAHDTYVLGGAVDQYTGKRPFADGPLDTMPSIFATATTGEAPLLTTMMNPDPSPLSDPTVAWISYLSSPAAAFGALPTVTLVNPNGSTVDATNDNFIAAVNEATKNADGTYSINTTPTNDNAYPLTTVSSVVVPELSTTDNRLSTVSDFLKWATTEGQDDSTLPLGYAKLPGSLVRQTLSVVDNIGVAPKATPTPTPTPTPSATPTPSLSPLAPLPTLPTLTTDLGTLPVAEPVAATNGAGAQVIVVHRASAFAKTNSDGAPTTRLIGLLLVAMGAYSITALIRSRA